MRTLVRISVFALALAFAFALAGCSGSGGTGDSALTPNEDPVPAGMPAMYEFYTDT